MVQGLMRLWELQDNTGSSPLLIWFTYQRWPLKMCEDIEDNGGLRRYSHWRLWHEKIFSEDYEVRRHSCFVVSFSYLLSHRNHRTVKWGPSEQSQSDWSDAQSNPKSSSEDNESKSYQEQDESGLLVACVWNLTIGTHVSSLVTQGHFKQIRSGCLVAINSPPLHHKLVAAQS